MITEELDFLRESNNIEDEWDDKSLQDAIIAWQYLRHQMIIRPRHILQIHALLMQSRSTLKKEEKGVFRNGPVWIGRKEAKPWFVVPELIENWCRDVDYTITTSNDFEEYSNKEKEERIIKHHIQYEAAHPFFDGNGRTGRMLYNWERKKMGLPIHVIHAGMEQKEYYTWFL